MSRDGKINVLLRYVNALFIKPADVTADLTLLPIELKVNDVGDTILRFTLVNKGSAHISPIYLQQEVVL